MGAPRTYVENDTFVQDKLEVVSDAQRMDRLLDGLTWSIAKAPDSGTKVGDRLWAKKSRPWPGAPELVIFYTFDRPGPVELHFLRAGIPDLEVAEDD